MSEKKEGSKVDQQDDEITYNQEEVVAECLSLQEDELAALDSIFGSETWKCVGLSKFEIQITSSDFPDYHVTLTVTFTLCYPRLEPPVFELSAPWMKPVEKEVINGILFESYLTNYQEPVVFRWIDEIRTFIDQTAASRIKNDTVDNDGLDIAQVLHLADVPSEKRLREIANNLVSSELIVDRRSFFQGHCIKVTSKREVDEVMQYLKSIPKVAKATHNILAYRFMNEKGYLNADHDEDGEHGAGSRLLHLLQITDVINVVVVVSRWFGGILLGPDRFKHINQAGRNALAKANFLTNSSS